MKKARRYGLSCWSECTDLNRGPLVPQTSALTRLSYTPMMPDVSTTLPDWQAPGAYNQKMRPMLLALSLSAALAAQPLLPVPDVRQSTPYSCGASALQAVLAYYGIELREDELQRRLGTTPEQGTHPDRILALAGELGFAAQLQENTTLEQLQQELAAGRPVLVMLQAWRDPDEQSLSWSDTWESGHYGVVIGIDEHQVYFEDPSLLGSRGSISRQQLLERWHDYETTPQGRRDYHRGAILLRGKDPRPPQGVVPIL